MGEQTIVKYMISERTEEQGSQQEVLAEMPCEMKSQA